MPSSASLSTPICDEQNLLESPIVKPPIVELQVERVNSQRVDDDRDFNINDIERDPGLRRLMCEEPILLGPCQPVHPF
ncbi:hypothetical protein L3X38_032306 [Prunus dulcis]|uniref:Uncharacterized protein n=1 Tax=Prunus dulcis TaxID=3755 RepID=A0AAD4VDR9_PRUDU|nr:hypothetical protein L3X38_032306 [Prunus dulcis]